MALDLRKPGTFYSAASAALFACPAMTLLLDTSSSAYTASAFSSLDVSSATSGRGGAWARGRHNMTGTSSAA